jgi:hypothetical protein
MIAPIEIEELSRPGNDSPRRDHYIALTALKTSAFAGLKSSSGLVFRARAADMIDE